MPDLADLTPDRLLEALEALDKHRRTNALEFWKPYPKQREFIALGLTKQERLLFAGNQMGKSDCGAYETATHLTGLYPDDWPGRRWERPTKGWVCSESSSVSRIVAQTKLCGEPGVEDALGTGFIPADRFVRKPTLARGADGDTFGSMQIYHTTNGVEDGISIAEFKFYEQGRKKFQGRTIDFDWWDEEPPPDVYTEGNARWSATGGMSFMTFTPVEGLSDVVVRFLHDTDPESGRAHVLMGCKDALHMTPEMIAAARRKYPPHEWGARIDGLPQLGSGRVFITDEDKITFPLEQFIPPHWPVLWGIDFGITHPFAAVLIAWDREADIIYVLATYRAADELPLVHSEAIRRIAADAPVAWPHDGHKRDPGSGAQLAKLYKALDLKTLRTHAHWPDGSISTEAAVLEMQQRLQDGRLRVRADLGDWFEEYRLYHRKDGQLVKVRDDLLSATMKAIMMKRHAKIAQIGYKPRPNKQMLTLSRPRQAAIINPWTGQPALPT